MSTNTNIECDGPGPCRNTMEREGGHNDGVIRAIAMAAGWAINIERPTQAPNYLPRRVDLCPQHKHLAPKRPVRY